MSQKKSKPLKPPTVSVVILAGGLSSRMGRDKSRIRIGRRTMLGHVRAIASQLGLPIRVLRRDAVPRCGPIGGIYTALARTRSDAILFLACDMPFVTSAFLNQMLNTFRRAKMSVAQVSKPAVSPISKSADGGNSPARLPFPSHAGLETRDTADLEVCATWKPSFQPALFASHKNLFGLPCLITRNSLPIISRQIAKSKFSLQSLARALNAKRLVPSAKPARRLLNLNTPEDLKTFRNNLRISSRLA